MGRQKNVINCVQQKIQLQEDLYGRMELELWSEVEGKVPYGARSAFINELIREYYRKQDETVGTAKAPQ